MPLSDKEITAIQLIDHAIKNGHPSIETAFNHYRIILTGSDEEVFADLIKDTNGNRLDLHDKKNWLQYHPDKRPKNITTEIDEAFELLSTAAFVKYKALQDKYPKASKDSSNLFILQEAVKNNINHNDVIAAINPGTETVRGLHLRISVRDKSTKYGIEEALKSKGIFYKEFLKDGYPMFVINNLSDSVVNAPNFSNEFQALIAQKKQEYVTQNAARPMSTSKHEAISTESTNITLLIERLCRNMMLDVAKLGRAAAEKEQELINKLKQSTNFEKLKTTCKTLQATPLDGVANKLKTFITAAVNSNDFDELESKLPFLKSDRPTTPASSSNNLEVIKPDQIQDIINFFTKLLQLNGLENHYRINPPNAVFSDIFIRESTSNRPNKDQKSKLEQFIVNPYIESSCKNVIVADMLGRQIEISVFLIKKIDFVMMKSMDMKLNLNRVKEADRNHDEYFVKPNGFK